MFKTRQIIADPPPSLPGGLERPLGNRKEAPDVRFAIGRLAIATSMTPREVGGPTSLVGYATGLTEVETPSGLVELTPFSDPKAGQNLTFKGFELAANTFLATISWRHKVNLGGAGASAWVNDATYGARSPDGAAQEVALVSGDPIAHELAGAFSNSKGEAIPAPGGYEHLKWGFFFGDLVTKEGERKHQHLGSFVAGPPITIPPLRDPSGPKGTATYSGHAIGDVYDGGDLRTVAGTFDESFNFNSRTGTTTLDFDGAAILLALLAIGSGPFAAPVSPASGSDAGALIAEARAFGEAEQWTEAARAAQEAVTVLWQNGAEALGALAIALNEYAQYVRSAGDPELAVDAAREAYGLATELNAPDWTFAVIAYNYGATALDAGLPRPAIPPLEAAVQRFERAGDPGMQARAVTAIGIAHLARAEHREAIARFAEAAALSPAESGPVLSLRLASRFSLSTNSTPRSRRSERPSASLARIPSIRRSSWRAPN